MCAHPNCSAGYRKCKNEPWCRPEHLMCDGKTHCKQSSDDDDVLCAQWNCSEEHWRCADRLQCIPINWVCDGDLLSTHKCRDDSDEDPAMCLQWNCPTGLRIAGECDQVDGCNFTKCADTRQCVDRKSICDGKFDCKDRSDELCNDRCLKTHLKPEEKGIVKMCQEKTGRCVSVNQYCDGTAQCPDASDETQQGCTCEDWGLISCHSTENNLQTYCMNALWAPDESIFINQSAIECQDFPQAMDTEIKMVESSRGM